MAYFSRRVWMPVADGRAHDLGRAPAHSAMPWSARQRHPSVHRRAPGAGCLQKLLDDVGCHWLRTPELRQAHQPWRESHRAPLRSNGFRTCAESPWSQASASRACRLPAVVGSQFCERVPLASCTFVLIVRYQYRHRYIGRTLDTKGSFWTWTGEAQDTRTETYNNIIP